MTTEQTEDEFTKKRRLAAQVDNLAGAIACAGGAIRIMRQDGLTSRMIVRQALDGLRPLLASDGRPILPPEAAGALTDDSMVDSMSALLDLVQMMMSGDRSATCGHIMGMMEGDPLLSGVVAKMESAMDHLKNEIQAPPEAPCWATIQRLFKENPSPLPDQAPAIECGVMLRGVPMTLMGSLSETPEGGLRLLSRSGQATPGADIPMIEQFFDYEDVMVIAVQRKVTVNAPRIIQSS